MNLEHELKIGKSKMLKLQLKQSELEEIKFMRDNKLVSFLLYIVKVLILYAYPIMFIVNTINDDFSIKFKTLLSVFILLPVITLIFRDIAKIVIMNTFDIIEVKEEIKMLRGIDF